MRVSEALDAYLVQLRADGRSDHTVRQVRRFVRRMAGVLGDPPVATMTPEGLAAYLASDAVARREDGGPRRATSANTMRSVLKGFFAFTHAAGYVRSNPARLVRRAKCAPPRPRGATEVDVGRLLAVLDGARSAPDRRDRAMFRLMVGVGLRVGSVVALDVRDVDLGDASLRVRTLKNADADTVYLSAELVALLREHVGERRSGPLFEGPRGRPLGTRQVARRLAEWCERAGIERRISPHALRHAFAMAAYARTGDVLLVSRMLCHRSLASTMVYARPSEQRVREAVRY